MITQTTSSLTFLEWLGIVGSIASLLSIFINIIQANSYTSLKKTLATILSSSESAFTNIADDSQKAIDLPVHNRIEVLMAINAKASQQNIVIKDISKRWINK